MANIQKQFEEFHDAIKLGRFDEEQTLREKRDIIRNKVDDRLPGIFEKHDEEVPTWRWRNQGSYEMGTGNKPINGREHDIDQGLYFDVSTDDYDPVTLKKRVHESLDGHTDDVRVRRPCVTVWYHKSGERVYHVDIACYSDRSQNLDRKDRLAIGRLGSSEENKSWDVSDPKGLLDEIFSRFEDEGRAQFRRTVRYFKRWKDKNFSSDGNAAPTGIALTVAAYHWLTNTYFDPFTSGKSKPDDHRALLNLVQQMLNKFNGWPRRLKVFLPVEPYSDLLEQMTDSQMEQFEEKLKKLRDALRDALDDVDPVQACKRMRKQFGDDFPIPEKKDTARRTPPPVSSSSNAA